MNHHQANELLPDALTAMHDLDAISMALAARLTQMEQRSIKGHDYLLRDAVMREVMEWRSAWSKNSAARPDFSAWNRRAAPTSGPAASSSGDLDALVREYGNAPVTGAARTRRVVMQEIYQLAGEIFGELAVDRDAVADMEARKDAAYLERNQVVAALAKAFPSGVARTAIEGWSEDWHGCVYLDLPTGQASWHFHDSHAYLFAGLPAYAGEWDGHDTPEKYRRLAALAAPAAPAVPAAPLVAYWATTAKGERCAFGVQSTAAAWAGPGGTVKQVEIAQLCLVEPSPSVDQAKRLVGGEVADWQSITAPGQVKVGDKLRFNIGDEQFNERVKQIINEGRADEELIYNKRKNYYVITKNILTGFGNVKNCQFLRASTGSATSTDTKESA